MPASDLVPVMNNLHKGRHAGSNWSVLIDLTAIIGTPVGVTGFALILFQRLRSVCGIAVATYGAVANGACYWVATS
tara:strand:- start:13 stop:240 length:228 start_codon:yes stop_codon:yes gene_type:complete